MYHMNRMFIHTVHTCLLKGLRAYVHSFMGIICYAAAESYWSSLVLLL